jgi:hypothetical protein
MLHRRRDVLVHAGGSESASAGARGDLSQFEAEELFPFLGGGDAVFFARAQSQMALLLGNVPGLEQVELDAAGDGGDAGLAGLPGGEVAGFLGFAGAGPAGAVADEQAGLEDHQQERRERTVQLVRGEKPRP